MKIILNGEHTTIDENQNISVLLSGLKINPQAVVVELNGNIINGDKFTETAIKENDQLEIIHFVGGG